MDLSVLFLGTAGSMPTVQRAPASLLIRRGGDRILIDCGEGSQRQLLRSVGLPELEHVFLTHFHADHFLGLPGMMKTFTLRGRDLPLHIYGPRGLNGLALGPAADLWKAQLRSEGGGARARRTRSSSADYRIGAYSVVHRTEALGYVLVEEDRPGRFDPEQARSAGRAAGPHVRGAAARSVRPGRMGARCLPEDVMGEAGRAAGSSSRGTPNPAQTTVAVAQGAELLVHDGTFSAEEQERARVTGHSTAVEAARIAAEAGVSLLALTHLSSRYFGPRSRRRPARSSSARWSRATST